jgi:small-conductance mechanosensitive channel
METTAVIDGSVRWGEAWWPALAVLAAATLTGWLARAVLYRRLRRVAQRTETVADDLLLEATHRLWLPSAVVVGLLAALRLAPVAIERRELAERVGVSALMLLLTLAATRFVGLRFTALRAAGGAAPARPSLIQKVTQVAVVVAGSLLILDNAGVEIATLLTALGVGSLAVALALQPTLSNLFAGIHLSAAKQLRVGDFVELEDGMQGHVVDIGWRATTLRQLANNLVVVPNAKIVDMRLVNYTLPDQPQAVVLTLGVGYGSDLRRVERVTVEVARSVQREIPEADPTHEPFVRYSVFGDSSIDFSVILRARTFTDRWPLIHEFLMRVKERFDAEGIEIPFPQRVVHQRPEPRS